MKQLLSAMLLKAAFAAFTEYTPEEAMRTLAIRAMEKCYDMNDFNSPEHDSFPLRGTFASDGVIPDLGAALVFDRVEPDFQVCSPGGGAWAEAWKAYHTAVEAEYPAPKKRKTDAKHVQQRIKVVAVSHPLRTIARIYLKDFKQGASERKEHADKFKIIEKRFGIKPGVELSFKVSRVAIFFIPNIK